MWKRDQTYSNPVELQFHIRLTLLNKHFYKHKMSLYTCIPKSFGYDVLRVCLFRKLKSFISLPRVFLAFFPDPGSPLHRGEG